MLPKTIFSKRETHGLRGWRGRVEQLFEQFRIGRIIFAISRGKSRMKLISRRNFFSSSLCRRLITLESVYENFNTIAAFLHAKLWKIIPLFARNICPPVDRIRFFPVFFFRISFDRFFRRIIFEQVRWFLSHFFFFFFLRNYQWKYVYIDFRFDQRFWFFDQRNVVEPYLLFTRERIMQIARAMRTT